MAAGFAPIGIGAETDGSIVQPGTRAGLFALKPSCGTTPLAGAMPINQNFDTIGAIGRTAKDLADMIGLLDGTGDYSTSLTNSWEGVRVGFVEFEKWLPASFVVEENEDFKQQIVSTPHLPSIHQRL